MLKFLICLELFKLGHGIGPKISSLGITKKCDPSVTTVSGSIATTGIICPGDLIFEENFNNLDLSVWEHENTLAGGGVSHSN